MVFLIYLIIIIALTSIIYTLAMAGAGWFVGVNARKIDIFFGPKIKSFTMGEMELNINTIPTGGSVNFGSEFKETHPIKQIFIACSGSMALVIVTMMVFGTSEGLQKFLNGFSQVFWGTVSPRSQGSQYLILLYEYMKINSFVLCTGLIASKIAAANLFPIPTFNGGEVFLIILNWVRPISNKFIGRLRMYGSAILLIIIACWIVASYFFVKQLYF